MLKQVIDFDKVIGKTVLKASYVDDDCLIIIFTDETYLYCTHDFGYPEDPKNDVTIREQVTNLSEQ